MDDEIRTSRRFQLERPAQRTAIAMFAIVCMLAVYALVQRLG
jgi:hypothetical protein